MDQINVMLVEDDPHWVKQLEHHLNSEPDINLSHMVSTNLEAIQVATEHLIDVVLMDINLSANDLDGFQTIKDLSKLGESNIIVISSINDNEIIMKSLLSGAINYLTREDYEDVAPSIRNAYAKQSSLHPCAAKVVLEEIRLSNLTSAERVIYHLREQGLSRTQIAAVLHRSVETIKSQIKQVSKKLKG